MNNIKIRAGFVSNSSSSSFLLYGVELEPSEKFRELEEENEDYAYDLEEKIEKLGLDFETMGEADYVWLGLSWSSVRDDETGKEFKQRVEESIKKFLAENKELFEDTEKVEFDTHQEAWRDG